MLRIQKSTFCQRKGHMRLCMDSELSLGYRLRNLKARFEGGTVEGAVPTSRVRGSYDVTGIRGGVLPRSETSGSEFYALERPPVVDSR